MNFQGAFPLGTQTNQLGGLPFPPQDAVNSNLWGEFGILFTPDYNNQDYLVFDTATDVQSYNLEAAQPKHGVYTDIDTSAPSRRKTLSSEIRSSKSLADEALVALNRKRAHNRAAQRAYRERGNRHLKELEERVGELKSACSKVSDMNGRLMIRLQELNAEKEALLAIERSLQRSAAGIRKPTLLQGYSGF